MKRLKLFEELLDEGYFDLENKDYVMYHATPTRNVPSIQKNGLNPSLPSGKEHSEGLAWMSDDIDKAIAHAASRMKKKGIDDTISVVVLKMNPAKDKLFKSLTPNIYTARDVVPPDKIQKIIPPNETP